MFLKKLKIKGFKSFAKSITINFDSSLTAIVGPNGSGKSNIVDAIRWVLGEQSASTLRGSRMADIIFAGSDTHKPLKKAGVSLYLDNSEQILPISSEEVKIARKIDDSGYSDYEINNSSCRLKDIQELILDTGLGRDSYSIVGQGKITSILNSKPDKIRELFEEAAGISRHKMRKEKAEKRLEKTNYNLQRIEDLISELKKQLPPLEKEARKAKKYQRLRQELSHLEISLLLDNWEQHDTELNSLASDRDYLQKQFEESKEVVEDLSAALKNERELLADRENEHSQLQEKHYSLKTKREEVENRLEIIAERRSSLEREKSNLREQLTASTEEIKRLTAQKEQLQGELEHILTDRDDLAEELKNKQNSLEAEKTIIGDKKEQLTSLQEGMNIKEKLKTEIDNIKEKIEFEKSNLEKVENEYSKIKSQIEKNRQKQDLYRKQLQSLLIKKSELNNHIENTDDSIQKQSQKLNEAVNDFNRTKDKLTEKKSRFNLLQDLEEDYDGYYRGVKSILKNKEQFPGIYGVVADLITTSRKYEQAVETALGSRLQNIIIEDDATARACINFLKENKKGRATFLPVNMIRGKRAGINKKIQQQKGFIGLASDLVTADKKLQEIIKYLLGRTVVSGNIDQAIIISKKMNSSLKIVALDGDVVNPGGAITGGSRANNNRNLLGRSRKIEELQQTITEIKRETENKKKYINNNREQLNELKHKKETNREKLHEYEIRQNNLQKDINNIKNDEEKLQEQSEIIEEKIKDCRQRLQSHLQKHERLLKKRAVYSEQRNGEKDIKNIEEEINNHSEIREDIREKITLLKIKKAEYNQKINNLEENKANLKNQLETNSERCRQAETKIDDIEKQLQELIDRKEELKKQKRDFKEEAEELQDRLTELKNIITRKKQKVKSLEQEYEQKQNEFNEIKDKLHKLELKINRLENKRERCEDQLLSEYDIDPAEDIVEDRINITNYTKTDKKIAELKNSIKELGVVNQGAIEEYEQLNERVEYLQEQQQDLIEARESINGIIDEIEETMGKQFYQTYSQVRKEFESIFCKLFSGGQAELTLTTPEDFLKTGVKISAQPPGKQLKKLSLMSGGERALTAIALVFAFLRVNPSPFYILDEIDAPLDDANVIRFARFIREFSDFAQFVIVTHNKQMMSRVDTLYGVSMEETGVSKLLSLRLDEQTDEKLDQMIS